MKPDSWDQSPDNPFGDKPGGDKPGGEKPFSDNPYQSPAGATENMRPHYDYRQPHRGGLILGLAMGGMCVLLFSFLCCLPLTAFSCAMGLAAWFMGRADVKKIDRGEMDSRGRDLSQIGAIIGLICGILSGIAVVLSIGFMIFILVAAAMDAQIIAE